MAASVIADNAAPQCSGTLNGSGNVSFPDASCGGINADPKLGPLDNNGGPTQTLLPAVGFPPLDTIATGGVGCAAGDTDQRGTPRPQGAKCDSGSVEAANPAIATDIAAADFGSIPAGRRATRTITIRSTFDPVHPTLALAGPGATAFAVTTNPCAGVLLAPAATCAVQVTFTSSGTPGARTATLHLAHDRLGAAIDVALTAAVAPAPAVSALSLSHTRFAVAGAVTARAKARRQRPPQGTTIRFRLSSPGSVAFAVTQSAPGRKRGKRCVAPTRILAHAKHCTRILVKGTFVRAEPAGSIRVPFSGRLRGGALQPGRYTFVLTPSDAAHNRGRGDSIGFTIVRRR